LNAVDLLVFKQPVSSPSPSPAVKSPAASPAGFSSASGQTGLTNFETEVVAVFADLVSLLGLPKSMGEIYGLIFASAQPISFAHIENKLELSKGSVSQGLKSLRELGAVRGVGGEGERREHWEATIELRQLIGTLLRERLVPYLSRQDHHLEKAETALNLSSDQYTAPDQKLLAMRLSKLQTWQSRARTILPLLSKML
jgi:HTH-type transcriptional regulator, glycine betaine synthesis regulator